MTMTKEQAQQVALKAAKAWQALLTDCVNSEHDQKDIEELNALTEALKVLSE